MRFPSAEREDRRALYELVTALVLVDELTWEGSSTLTDVTDPPLDPDFGKRALDSGGHQNLAWVYRWFPKFETLRQDKTLLPTYLYDVDRDRLGLAQELVVKWIAGMDALRRTQTSLFVNKIPLCYRDPAHPDRHAVRTYGDFRPRLTEDEISVALFVSRGVFYQACTKASNLEGYLPHSCRGYLLQDEGLREIVDYCALCTNEISATQVLEWVDSTVYERARAVATRGLPQGKGMSVGGSFFRGTASPLAAWESAIAFREGPSGIELRQHFRGLLDLAAQDDKIRINQALVEIDKQLVTATIHVKGCLDTPPAEERLVLDALPWWGKAAHYMLPESAKGALRKALFASLTNKSPYQMLFDAYLKAPRHDSRAFG